MSIWISKMLRSHLWWKSKSTTDQVAVFRCRVIFLWKGQSPISQFIFFNMAIPWKSNSSLTEIELEPCFLWLSKLCYSKCSVNAPVRFCQLLPVSKENYLYLTLWHVLVTDSGYSGHRPSDPFLLSSISFATFLSCTKSPSLAFHPNLLPLPRAFCPDTSPSPACSFLSRLFLLGFPKQQQGAK